jgi:hypothetical protein
MIEGIPVGTKSTLQKRVEEAERRIREGTDFLNAEVFRKVSRSISKHGKLQLKK